MNRSFNFLSLLFLGCVSLISWSLLASSGVPDAHCEGEPSRSGGLSGTNVNRVLGRRKVARLQIVILDQDSSLRVVFRRKVWTGGNSSHEPTSIVAGNGDGVDQIAGRESVG